jgi:hypothetical protein
MVEGMVECRIVEKKINVYFQSKRTYKRVAMLERMHLNEKKLPSSC